MSVTGCRNCGENISFVRTVNGRWRPVEVVFEELEAEGNEVLTVLNGGSWTEMDCDIIRVYRPHACPENPGWNQGRPRMRTGNEATGEVQDDEPEPEPKAAYKTPTMTNFEKYEADAEARWRKRNAQELLYPCRECGVEPGEVCRTKHGRRAQSPHRPRYMATHFDDSQPWPPASSTQRGVRAMRSWLLHYGDIFERQDA